MLVVEAARFGGPEVLAARQVPDPVAGPGQAVIRTTAAAVLFVDVLIRSGRAADYFRVRPPYVPGNGVSGTVISAGDGVDPAWAGRPVVAHTGGPGGSGGYAGQALVAAADLIPVPEGLGLPQAAALLHDGATGLRLLELVSAKPGEWVLVTAAAGGMGVLLVQLARAAARCAQRTTLFGGEGDPIVGRLASLALCLIKTVLGARGIVASRPGLPSRTGGSPAMCGLRPFLSEPCGNLP